MHLLDTDTLTHLHHGHPKVVERLRKVDDTVVGTTVITRIEVIRARCEAVLKAATGEELLLAHARLERSEMLLSRTLTVPIDEVAAAKFDELRDIKGLRKIGRADLLIASITLAHDATLVTRNLRHFRQVPGLKLANWVD